MAFRIMEYLCDIPSVSLSGSVSAIASIPGETVMIFFINLITKIQLVYLYHCVVTLAMMSRVRWSEWRGGGGWHAWRFN